MSDVSAANKTKRLLLLELEKLSRAAQERMGPISRHMPGAVGACNMALSDMEAALQTISVERCCCACRDKCDCCAQ